MIAPRRPATPTISALSLLIMTDVYVKNLAGGRPDPTRVLLLAHLTMVVSTAAAVWIATPRLHTLTLLVIAGRPTGRHRFPGDRQHVLGTRHQTRPSRL